MKHYISSIHKEAEISKDNQGDIKSKKYIEELEILTKTDSALVSMELLSQSICLLTWTIPKDHEMQEAVGTAFLCSLPKEYDYKVVLFTAGHNFASREGVTFDQGYPYHDYNMYFHNLKGITS